MKRLGSPKVLLAGLLLLTLAPIGWSADGLDVTIESVIINSDLKPEVTFSLKDSAGDPVAIGSEDGDASARFIIARLDVVDAEKGSAYYWGYNVRIASATEGAPNEGASAEQTNYDSFSAERLTELAPGQYHYVFQDSFPSDYDRTKTHTVSAQIARTVDGVVYVANPIHHFVPNGQTVVSLRKVVTTDACNKCHTNLGLHGGNRMEVTLCIMCHSPQSSDPETGNSVDMTTMIHKIHMGAELPSVQGGGKYEIIGYRGSAHDYSHVEFPVDNRNCTVCHTGEQGDVYKTAPSRRSCGSCHDNIDFANGVGHMAQTDDNLCANCHQPEGSEFGISITGAHTIPAKSSQLKGLTATILEVSNALPGQAPTVRFTVKENDGTLVDPATLRTLAVTFGGPSQEFASYTREDGTASCVLDGDAYTYTMTTPIPADAQGTYAFSLEARRNVTIVDNPEGEDDVTATEAASNPIYLVAVTGTELVQRRVTVDENKCNGCHGQVSLHGSLRNNIAYCVVCHNPNVSDIEQRGEGVTGGEAISFSYMIHKIHAGEHLNNGYTVYGYGGRPHDYSHVVFPGNRNACSTCHTTDVPALPLADEIAAINITTKEGEQVNIPPTTAACTSCHDGAVEHANQYNAGGTEICAGCHGQGSFMDIAQFHKLDRVLNVVETTAEPGTLVRDWYLQN